MEKVLSYNIDNGATAECGNFYKMAIVTSYDRYTPWVMEHFIKLQMYEGFILGNYNIYGTEHQTFYDEVLEQHEIENKDNIIETIINSINNNGYVILRTDRYYIPGGEEFQKHHFTHPMLICGYDDDKREFFVLEVSLFGTNWAMHKFDFSVVETAYYAGLELMREDFNVAFGPLEVTTGCILYTKPFNRKIKIKYVYDNVCMMLKGADIITEAIGEYEKPKTIRDLPIDRVHSLRRLGISIYKSYYEDLFNLLKSGYRDDDFFTGSFGVYHGVEILIQNKVGLKERINYLIDNGYIPNDRELVINTEKLCDVLETSRNVLAKYYYSNEESILLKAQKGFIEAENIERIILKSLKGYLEQYLSKTL